MARLDLSLDPAYQVAALIPSLPERRSNGMRLRALASVWAQTHPVRRVSLVEDVFGEGAAITRQRCLDVIDPEETPWVAPLDDDDEWKRIHIERLVAFARRTGADLIYPWFDPVSDVPGKLFGDPLGHFGKPFDPTQPQATTITFLVRTACAHTIGWRMISDGVQAGWEDEDFIRRFVAAGFEVRHLPERTWWWHWHGENTGPK